MSNCECGREGYKCKGSCDWCNKYVCGYSSCDNKKILIKTVDYGFICNECLDDQLVIVVKKCQKDCCICGDQGVFEFKLKTYCSELCLLS